MANRTSGRPQGGPRRDAELEAVEEPSWAIPATVIVVVGILSLGFLAYYLAPTASEILGHAPAPSEQSLPVDVTIAGQRYLIPANYTRFAYGRRGGIQDKIELYALLPDLQGYDPGDAAAFQDYSPSSRVVYFDIEVKRDMMPEEERLRRVYLKLVTSPQGTRGPYGLRRYEFDRSTGYRDEDLLVFGNPDGTVVLFRCMKELARIASPTCRRDLDLGNGLALHYRFMRSQLSNWDVLNKKILTLVRSFAVAPKPQ